MSKSSTNRARRETVEQMRRQAQAAERRRTLTVVAVCVVVALVIVGLAGYTLYTNNQEKEALVKQNLDDLGASAEAAGCVAVVEDDASGEGDHVSEPVDYETNPPASGPHFGVAADGDIHFYDADDRPAVEQLVHNLEHGWTIVWYDEMVAADDEQMNVLTATAEKLDAEGDDPQYSVILAPWTSEDGVPIPDGKHIALTHWSVHQPVYDPEFFKSDFESFGVSQYCDSFSGEALAEFIEKYPYDDSPEGYIWHATP